MLKERLGEVAKGDRQPGSLDMRLPAWLGAYAARRHVPFLDLTEPVQAAGAEALYLRNDAHWNPEGHRLVARELQRFLRGL